MQIVINKTANVEACT